MQGQRIYLVGAGVIARQHAAAIRNLPESQHVVLSVADPNEQVLEEFIGLYPQAQPFRNAQTMLAEPAEEHDIVIVATPPHTHFELTCMALTSGRHVLCEKPLAMQQAQAHQMLEVAQAQHRLLGCCSVRFLHWPAAEAVRQLLQEQALGPLYHVRFLNIEQRNRPGIEYQPGTYWFLEAAKSGGGTLMDRAPYEFTVLNDLLHPQRVDVLSAWIAHPTTALHLPPEIIADVEQHAGASLRYYLPDGTTTMLTYERASCMHGEEHSLIEITGLKGSVRWHWPLRGTNPTLTYSYDHNGLLESKVLTYPRPGSDEIRIGDKPLLYFYQRVHGQPSSAVVNEQAIFNFACIRAIYDCAASGQAQSVVWGK